MPTPRSDDERIHRPETDHQWRPGLVDRVDGDLIRVSYLDGAHAVIRVQEPMIGNPTGLTEINEALGFCLLGTRVYRSRVVVSTAGTCS